MHASKYEKTFYEPKNNKEHLTLRNDEQCCLWKRDNKTTANVPSSHPPAKTYKICCVGRNKRYTIVWLVLI